MTTIAALVINPDFLSKTSGQHAEPNTQSSGQPTRTLNALFVSSNRGSYVWYPRTMQSLSMVVSFAACAAVSPASPASQNGLSASVRADLSSSPSRSSIACAAAIVRAARVPAWPQH